ncbi:MAG: hypothetical protein ACE5Q6_14115 [Dehalococcoidia bacterium]
MALPDWVAGCPDGGRDRMRSSVTAAAASHAHSFAHRYGNPDTDDGSSRITHPHAHSDRYAHGNTNACANPLASQDWEECLRICRRPAEDPS